MVTSTLTLTAGTYYVGISLSADAPDNSVNSLLFAGYPNGDTTAIRGPAFGLNPAKLSTFDDNPYTPATGSYEIDFVPEPSTWAVLVLGGFTAGAVYLRRKASAI